MGQPAEADAPAVKPEIVLPRLRRQRCCDRIAQNQLQAVAADGGRSYAAAHFRVRQHSRRLEKRSLSANRDAPTRSDADEIVELDAERVHELRRRNSTVRVSIGCSRTRPSRVYVCQHGERDQGPFAELAFCSTRPSCRRTSRSLSGEPSARRRR